jgi:splicing factor U2AF subunit
MGRSRSRKEGKERKEKDEKKDRKRSRSRKKEKKDRSKSRKREKEPQEEIPPPQPARQRSPDFGYRRWRFDSPPKEEEYARDAMLTGNPMGLGGVAAALAGGLGGVNTAGVSPLTLAQDTKAMRELYVGNLPAGITSAQLCQFMNQVAQAVKVNSLPGEPILSATMGGGGLFAFVEFRTAEEAANGLRLNGVELLGSQLKIGRPKGYTEGGAGGQLALPGAPGQLALPGPGGQGNVVSAIDHRLCLINIPTFVSEERIRELLITFGQLKFFALQKDQNQKSVGVAFFEYNDMMTQQQARAALEGLELGAKKLSVKRPEEVIQMGLVSREQKLGHRVVASKIIFLKNIVTPDDLRSDAAYTDICADIRLEAEKFGPVVSIEVPRSRGGGSMPHEAPMANMLTGMTFALEDTKPDKEGGEDSTGATAKARPKAPDALAPAPMPKPVDQHQLAIISKGALAIPGSGGNLDGPTSAEFDASAPGIGWAFIEFANIEGASKAKKALHGRRFGANEVEAEYFSEDKYYARDFGNPQPNQDEPKSQIGLELALVATENKEALEEAPVMAD